MGVGVRVGLVLFFLHVLGLIFVYFILFFSMFKDQVLFIMY